MDPEQFAYAAFLAGLGLTAAASACYVALPLWPRVTYRSAATDAGATVSVAAAARPPAWLAPLARAATWLALAALTASLAARWAAAGRPPYANMWEFTVGFGWAILLCYALFEWRFQGGAEGRPATRAVGALVVPVALALFAASLAFFPSELRPLIPALQSSRILGAHVATMMLSYAVLSVSFGAAAVYLLQARPERQRRSGERRFARLPSGEALEEIANRSVLLGFP
ncbi:MAG: cytochrome c biogenesis protein CcsA, partial [Chloroflexi bacterium]|nr:cytochrome c biogenesis protein CcsA [Chloroflexota bacterium]